MKGEGGRSTSETRRVLIADRREHVIVIGGPFLSRFLDELLDRGGVRLEFRPLSQEETCV